ncbi:MAG TPA: 16S rRNA (cytosine(967)-C(5))-methyltransferase RsmB [Myxococcaceae bacterium]|nr:16S rRNA (cytosine(967)-C(5))-methyltransferase RsmB [Myxococcaceae bacterium]
MSARTLAIEVLARVAATDAYLNVVLDTALSEAPPTDARDAGLATELVYGTTRRQLTLDHAIAPFSTRKLETLEDKVLAALRIGAYQLFYLRTPVHAAVGDTVQALKDVGLTRASGFVNAILRKLSKLEAIPLPPPEDAVAHLSIRESHPAWLVRRWLAAYGREQTEAILVANNSPAPLTLRVNRSRIERAEMLTRFGDAGLQAHPTRHSSVGIVIPQPGRVQDLDGYDEGLWQVQDEAAQLVGLYAAFPREARIYDACAAPGGKACHLAERNEVVAADLHANKLRKIKAEALRLGVDARITLLAHDATQPLPASAGRFDAALVDAPCSGLGTLRRHPELRYRRQEEDIARLAALQERIFNRAAEAIPPGGLLVWSVCTTEPEEGIQQVKAFLKSHPGWSAEPPAPTAGLSFPSTESWLRTLPGPEGFDGFFAARLRRLY